METSKSFIQHSYCATQHETGSISPTLYCPLQRILTSSEKMQEDLSLCFTYHPRTYCRGQAPPTFEKPRQDQRHTKVYSGSEKTALRAFLIKLKFKDTYRVKMLKPAWRAN